MMRFLSLSLAAAVLGVAATASADPLTCSLTGYTAAPGLTAAVADNTLTLTWDGDKTQEVRMRLGVEQGAPMLRELAAHRKGSPWSVLAANVSPEFKVVAGFRRMSNQQMQPLNELKVPITDAIINEKKWDAFWDAPLFLGPPPARAGNPPPTAGIANQPGLPRKADEISRASASWHLSGCAVKTNGARIEVTFAGVTLGPFEGGLRFTVYKGTNLFKQEVVAKTTQPSVAYKYDAGLKGMPIQAGARATWRDIANTWQQYQFGGAQNTDSVPVRAANRVILAEQGKTGSIAAFPPPHIFFWAREEATNLGYNFYRKDSPTTYAFGIRQAEKEESVEFEQNFALYSARPGTEQRMAVFFYPSVDVAQPAMDAVLAFTHGDRFKPMPGYQVMNHHYHMDLGTRLMKAGSYDADIPDLPALKALGINIVSQIDSVGFGGAAAPRPEGATGAAGASGQAGRPPAPPAGERPPATAGPAPGGRPDQLAMTLASVEGARRNSDTGFFVMPNQEYYGSPLGGHTDLMFSHPVYWTGGRKDGQPLSEKDAKYGTVYHIGNSADLMEMARREDVLISMPHPRTKGSTGFPDAVKDDAPFADPHYQGVGFRWGMGVDLSEQRLCDYRCLPLLDDMSNWVADKPIPPKYLLSISEVRLQQAGDDIYASSPVSYVKMASLPPANDPSPIIKTLMKGDYYITSGEVLFGAYGLTGTGAKRTFTVDVEWTFPLEFVEVVWGDGTKTDRQIIPATDLGAFGKHTFAVPFDATGKKWVRFAAWDVAGNGATGQPIKLTTGAAAAANQQEE